MAPPLMLSAYSTDFKDRLRSLTRQFCVCWLLCALALGLSTGLEKGVFVSLSADIVLGAIIGLALLLIIKFFAFVAGH